MSQSNTIELFRQLVFQGKSLFGVTEITLNPTEWAKIYNAIMEAQSFPENILDGDGSFCYYGVKVTSLNND
jgi:hypothetical protein